MTKQEYLMIVAMEECAEVAQALSKCIRFGPNAFAPFDSNKDPATNVERVCEELDDLVAVLEMLFMDHELNFLEFSEANKQRKKEKVRLFMPEDLK